VNKAAQNPAQLLKIHGSVQMLQAFTSLTDDEREMLAELLKKMG
jgi:hypothetical protein